MNDIRIVYNFYTNLNAKITVNKLLAKDKICRGVRQRHILSILLLLHREKYLTNFGLGFKFGDNDFDDLICRFHHTFNIIEDSFQRPDILNKNTYNWIPYAHKLNLNKMKALLYIRKSTITV